MGSAPGRGIIPTVARAECSAAQLRRSRRGFLGGHGRSPVGLSCKGAANAGPDRAATKAIGARAFAKLLTIEVILFPFV